MYKLCQTEEAAARQRELENGLLEYMKTIPYRDVTISGFCTHMNIPRKAFYRYFNTREGALLALIDHRLEDMARSLQGVKSKDSVLKNMEAFLHRFMEQKPFLDILKENDLHSLMIKRAIIKAMDGSIFPLHLTADLSNYVHRQGVLMTISGMFTVLLSWHDSGFACPVKHMAEIIYTITTQPISTFFKSAK